MAPEQTVSAALGTLPDWKVCFLRAEDIFPVRFASLEKSRLQCLHIFNCILIPRCALGKWAVVHCPTCLDNVTLLTSALGSGNYTFLAKESNAPASNGLKKNHEEDGR